MSSQDPSVARALDLVAAGRPGEGIALIQALADARNTDAVMQLALWNLIGQPIPRDLPQARRLLRQAAQAGHSQAATMEIALTANGSGAPPSWPAALDLLRKAAARDEVARRDLAMLAGMNLDDEGKPRALPRAEGLCDDPQVVRYPQLLTPDECAHIAMAAQDLLAPSSVLDPKTGRQIAHPIRTSDGAVIGPTREDLVIRALNQRIAAASGTEVAQGEALAVLRYAPGQQYRLHLDTIAGATNQRIKTVLIYLNEGYAGGETVFPTLNVSVRARGGDAVVFTNVRPDGRPDERTRHAGLPVRAGAKWLATRWIRHEAIDPWTMGGAG